MDGRTDLWALGATMFAVLTGQCVHPGESGAQMAARAATRAPRKLREVAPEVPAPLAEVVDRALAFEKRGRWADAEQMGRGLRRAYEATGAQGEVAEPGEIRASLMAQGGADPGKIERELRSAPTRTMTQPIGAEAGRGVVTWARPHRRRAAMAFAVLVAVVGLLVE